MNIVHISDDIKKEFKVTSDGLTSVSIRGAARIAGVDEKALRKNLKFKGADFSPSKMAEMLIDNGFKGADFSNFSTFGIPDVALGIILQYYTFEAEENCTQQAKLAYQSFAVIGIRTWIQNQLQFFKQTSEPKTGKYLTPTENPKVPSRQSFIGRVEILMFTKNGKQEYSKDVFDFSSLRLIDLSQMFAFQARMFEAFDLALYPEQRVPFDLMQLEKVGGLLPQSIAVEVEKIVQEELSLGEYDRDPVRDLVACSVKESKDQKLFRSLEESFGGASIEPLLGE